MAGTPSSGPWSARRDTIDPAIKLDQELAKEFLGRGIDQRAAGIDELVDSADIRLRLLHDGHVQINKALAELMVGAESADGARGHADNRRRFAAVDALSVGTRANVDGVLECSRH